ncbi:cellular tumor antigen p53-like isoform X2 [Cimex lectularius]|uniref:p53 DNA-binding domain-containing protein n=1 Tax=Cimex lectularius TaxID=79782 RepID=A0A8I6RDV1_CIMLE|nr:cellular tumor antigen p53-like isoform X2 [Cimex lectularius]
MEMETTVKKEELEDIQICDSTQVLQESAEDIHNNKQVPSLSNFPGIYNFEFFLRNSGSYKSSWEYSNIFNQVFIDMNKVLMVQFVYDCPVNKDEELFIRAMPVYCSTDYIGLPVNRCTIHSIEDDPTNEAHGSDDICRCPYYNLVGHVVRSQSAGAMYFYNRHNRRHSVALQLVNQQPGRNSFDILYTFACKTSCQKGMQRRPINVVFTLENARGEILGRSVLGVKICSCPKRDKDRLEKDAEKNGIKTHQLLTFDQKEDDPLSDREGIKARVKAELRQIHKLQSSFAKAIRNLEELLKHI